MRLVLDSSVLIAAVKPAEPEHTSARAFVEMLRAAQASGAVSAFAPPELWLEVHVVEQRIAAAQRGTIAAGDAMRGLAVELVAPESVTQLTSFLGVLVRRMRGRRPFANATDLVYLWAGAHAEATVVTVDQGLLKYNGVVCDVIRPQHARLA